MKALLPIFQKRNGTSGFFFLLSMTREKMRGTESRVVTFSEGSTRFKRRVFAEGESAVTAVALLRFPPVPMKANSYPSRRNRRTSGEKDAGRGEKREREKCLVSATQWGHSLKGLEPRRPKLWVRVTSTRKREKERERQGREGV